MLCGVAVSVRCIESEIANIIPRLIAKFLCDVKQSWSNTRIAFVVALSEQKMKQRIAAEALRFIMIAPLEMTISQKAKRAFYKHGSIAVASKK